MPTQKYEVLEDTGEHKAGDTVTMAELTGGGMAGAALLDELLSKKKVREAAPPADEKAKP